MVVFDQEKERAPHPCLSLPGRNLTIKYESDLSNKTKQKKKKKRIAPSFHSLSRKSRFGTEKDGKVLFIFKIFQLKHKQKCINLLLHTKKTKQ